MKSDANQNLISKLNRIREELEVLASPESQNAFLKRLDDLIEALSLLRAGLAKQSLQARAEEIRKPIEEVIVFLEFAKSDETLRSLLSNARKLANQNPKRQPIEIPGNLTKEQIRALLEKDLSLAELKAIAAQRAISVSKSNPVQIKENILKNLERQEGYERLASHRTVVKA